ncbi:hypothetical protein BKA62DRAFT_831308 [Auriculariales sp. MPI-PUGE-AT-0066]|nr:hypothetical protein BKA62DRAFT_831308 [Auriculariales sp. MPI-PUGE-AT-0066]
MSLFGLLVFYGISLLLSHAEARKPIQPPPPPFNGEHLFPVPVLKAWTTAPSNVVVPTGVDRLPLSDDTLDISHVSWATAETGTAPDGTTAHKAFYPKDSFSKAPGGLGGWGYDFKGPVDLSQSDHVLFSYAVYFPADFDFVLGGKLPGPFGGSNDETAHGCAGGRQDGRDLCWSSRLMWRENGAGEIYVYVYLPDNKENLLRLQGSEADPGIYGFSIARGAFTFARGGWTVVSQRIKLNTLGQKDGELELWVNGTSVIHATGVVLRKVAATQVRGIEAETFFGGSNSNWASPRDQTAWIAGYSAALLGPDVSPAQRLAAYPLASAAPQFQPATFWHAAALIATLFTGVYRFII